MEAVYSSDVIPFFKGKGVKEECECCGKEDWVIVNNLTELVFRSSHSTGLIGIPIVVIECTNCGNMRFFPRERMKLKKDEKS